MSDQHYGIARSGTFQGGAADAKTVNQALVTKINMVPAMTFPADSGVKAGKAVGYIDFIIEGGDVANRHDKSAPDSGPATTATTLTAAQDWADFTADFIGGLTLKKADNSATPLYLIPGNHEVSNAIGYYKFTNVTGMANQQSGFTTDGSPMLDIYKRMINSSASGTYTKAVYDTTSVAGVPINKINYSRDIGQNGDIHVLFLNMWPDSGVRKWVDLDLASVPITKPVIIFIHDEPAAEAKHFTNPVSPNDINSTNKFEDLLGDQYADGATVAADGLTTATEQRAMVAWLKTHPNIVAYFHGNSNWNNFYEYKGPDSDIVLKTYRVDSPMKGDKSSTQANENLVSFHVGAIDPATMTMTVRECRWNPTPTSTSQSTVSPAWSTDTSTAYTNGDVNTPVITVPLTVATPAFGVTAGTYTAAQTVAITCATTGTTIHYTTDGSTPTATSTVYSAPLTISATTTVKALAISDTFSSKAPSLSSATYTIAPAGTSQSSQSTSSDDGHSCGLGSGVAAFGGMFLLLTFSLRLRRRR